MKKKTCWQGLLIAVVLAVLVYCLWAVDNVGNHLQYVVETTGDIAEAAAELTSLAEEWEITQRAWTLRGIIQEAAMMTESQVANGRITLCGDNEATLPLLHGRVFTAEELVSGAFDIPAPPDVAPVCDDPRLVIVPGLAFDPKNLMRLGRGGGYYDRWLAGKTGKLIAPCRSIQLVEDIPHGRYDIPMHMLVTAEKIYEK